jgi:hypothetical protein
LIKLIRNILFPILVLLLSCDKVGLFISCDDCTADEPVKVNLDVAFDQYKATMLNPPEINVYEGNIEDSILLGNYTPKSSPTEITVGINKKYTLTATYNYYDHTIIAFDSATPGVKYESDKCDDPCYYVYDNKVNLKIKYSP